MELTSISDHFVAQRDLPKMVDVAFINFLCAMVEGDAMIIRR